MVRIWVASLHQKSSSVFSTLEFFVLLVRETHKCGWIRTAAATALKTAQKQPSGLFLAARLAQSTRAHQKTSAYASALRFLFCNKAKLIERVDSNSCGDGAEDGAKTAQWAVFSSAARAIHPRPPRTPISEPGTGVSVLSAMQKGCKGRFEQYRFILSPTDIASAPDL